MTDRPTVKKVGRPSKITPDVIQKLESAFHIDCTIEEACLCAGISESTYYDHAAKDEEFSEKMTRAQKWAIQSARSVLFNAMKEGNDGMGDGKLALEVIKRRDKRRYSEKTESEVTGKDGEPIQQSVTVKFV